MDRWLEAVRRTAARDPRLASEVARLAQLVKGYGDVRRRLVGLFDTALDTVLRADEAEARGSADARLSTAAAVRLRTLVLEGPEGEARAATLAAAVRARLDGEDLAGARALLST